MKNYLFLFLCFFSALLLITQCQQPRPTAESSTDPGAKLFLTYCSRCHLGNGTGGPAPGGGINAVDIRQFTKSAAELETIIGNGFGQMPAFKDSLSNNDISVIANYVATQIELHTASNTIQPGEQADKGK